MGLESDSNIHATSLSLLDRVKGHDQQAWERLVHIYGPLVHYWIRKTGVPEASVPDLGQEVWQSVTKGLPHFQRNQQEGTFRGWLYTITRNKVNDHFRSGHPVAAGGTTAHQLFDQLPETEPPDDTGVQQNQLLQRAMELIRPDFEERTWQAFWKMAVDGQSAVEVGEALDMAPNAVHQAKFRILKRLRMEMAGLVDA